MKKCLRNYFESCLNIEQAEYDHPVTITELVKRESYPRNPLKNFVQGLPSWFSVAYMNGDIEQIMCECCYKNTDQYVERYWNNAAIFLRDKMARGL
jgi:hypothetical protein